MNAATPSRVAALHVATAESAATCPHARRAGPGPQKLSLAPPPPLSPPPPEKPEELEDLEEPEPLDELDGELLPALDELEPVDELQVPCPDHQTRSLVHRTIPYARIPKK